MRTIRTWPKTLKKTGSIFDTGFACRVSTTLMAAWVVPNITPQMVYNPEAQGVPLMRRRMLAVGCEKGSKTAVCELY